MFRNQRLTTLGDTPLTQIRPLLGKERPLEVSGTAATHSANSPRHTLAVSDDQRQLLLGTDKRFHFDRIYQPLATQSELYDNSVRPLLDRCFAEKVHGTVFAYGQTGSGKTHTMGDGASTISSGDDREGVIPRAIRQLFEAVEVGEAVHAIASSGVCSTMYIQQTASTNDDVRVHVRVSFLEIYQEEVCMFHDGHWQNTALPFFPLDFLQTIC